MDGLLTRRICIVGGTALAVVRPSFAQTLRAVTIGIGSPSLPAAGARIAKVMGLFERHGVDPKLKIMENASVATMALISGSVDFNSAGGPDIVVAQARGQKLIAVTSVYSGFGAVVVLSKAVADRSGTTSNSPIAQRLRALDGLVLASPSSSSPYTMALKNSAEAVGAKIRLTYMGQPAMVAALQSGVIQGFVASSPYYAQPVLSGAAVVWVIGPKGEFPPQYTPANSVTLNARRDFAEANRELVRRMTTVFADLADAVANRPADVKAAVAKLFPDTDTNTLDLLFDIESKGFNAKLLTVEDMAHEIDFVKQSGQQMAELDQLDPKSLLFQ